MSCKKCLINPNFHSFVNFGRIASTNLFYTSPARSMDYNKDGTKLENFKCHLQDTNGAPWIWVIDCNGMGVKDYTDTLISILFINPNTWVKTTVGACKKMFKSSIFDRVQYCEGSPIELFLMYEKLNIPPASIKWLISIDAGKVLPTLPIF
jgi:hypothetical protein